MKTSLISALKRNDRKDILTEVLLLAGNEAGAEEVTNASRVTGALIDRVCNLASEPVQEEDTFDTDEDGTDLTYEDAQDASDEEEAEAELLEDVTIAKITKAISKGKIDKALKLIASAKEDGSVSKKTLKELKKQAKEA